MKMKTLTNLIAMCCLLIGLPCLSQTDSTKNIYTWDYKITKKEFVKKYATDDTSRALIDMFYQKRHGIIAPAIIIFTAMTTITLLFPKREYDQISQPAEIGIGIMALISVPTTLATWNRRTLLILLNDYHHRIPLPQEYEVLVKKYMQSGFIKTYR